MTDQEWNAKCRKQIYSEEYQDYLVEYAGDETKIQRWYSADCYQIASERFAVIYLREDEVVSNHDRGINVIPRCFGLLSSSELLEQIGVAQVQRQSTLSLYGQGIMIGFVDTGIDYTHPAFINEDGSSRIWSIWDQTMEEETEQVPDGFSYGREYSQEEITAALASDDPWSVVPSRDTNGHGTFLAGVACGNQIVEKDFTGVAPLSSICVVKCKEAKSTLRDYYHISGTEVCYSEADIMLAVRYLWNQAGKREMPIVICIGIGTSQGGHNRGGILGELLQSYGDYLGTVVVAAAGNEANTSHHYRSELIEPGNSTDVELRVGEQEEGFTMELWSDAPDLYSIGLISPSGEYSGKTVARIGEQATIRFLLENTVVNIEYLLISNEGGDECIRIRFRNPQEGIWRIRVFNENSQSGSFHIWLPIRNFLSADTYFLQSNTDTTICDPANNASIITVTYFNGSNQSVSVDSSRGYNRLGLIRPDIVAPGIEILGPLPGIGNPAAFTPEEWRNEARFAYQSGSSIAAAVTAGAACLLLEWGFDRRNDITMDTVKVQKYLIRGANRDGMEFPNRLWGNGQLDLFGVFDALRPK